MGKRGVMCTSTGCIDYAPERYKQYGIDIIRIRVLFQGKEYLEGLDLDPVDFYNQLEKLEDPKNHLPKTAMPTPEEIRGHFDKAYENGSFDRVITTNLTWQPPELKTREWFLEADMSKFLATIIDFINHDASLSGVTTPTEKIREIVAKYNIRELETAARMIEGEE